MMVYQLSSFYLACAINYLCESHIPNFKQKKFFKYISASSFLFSCVSAFGILFIIGWQVTFHLQKLIIAEHICFI